MRNVQDCVCAWCSKEIEEDSKALRQDGNWYCCRCGRVRYVERRERLKWYGMPTPAARDKRRWSD